MVLNIPERIVLFGILPEKENFVTMKIIKDLRSNLLLSEEDIKEGEIILSEDGQMITWKKMVEKDVPIGEKATDVVITALKKLDSEKALEERHMPLWEKFIGGV